MKKTIYLHIGWHKTGTSSIQGFLFKNKEALLQKGLFFPDILKNKTEESTFRAHNGCFLAYNILQRPQDSCFEKKEQEKIWKELSKALRRNTNKKIILSSEDFSFCSASDVKKKFREHIKNIEDYEFKIIVYVRKSIDFLVSFYGETQKRNNRFNISLESFLNKDPKYNKEKNIYHRMHLIKNNINNIYKYIEVFGKENIILRPFEKEQLKNNSLIDDFLNCFDLENSNSFKKLEKNLNVTGSREATDMLRAITQIPDLSDGTKQLLRNKFMFQNLKTDTKPIDSISDDLIKKVVDENYAMEKKLAKDLLNKDELFLEKYPKCYGVKREKYMGLKPEHILRITSALIDIKIQKFMTASPRKKKQVLQKKKKSALLFTIKFLGIFIPSKTIRRKMRNWGKKWI